MRESAWVEYHALARFARGVERVNQFSFVVALESLKLSPKLGRTCRHSSLELLQRHVAVNLRVALAQEVQVGAVDEGNFGHHWMARGFIPWTNITSPKPLNRSKASSPMVSKSDAWNPRMTRSAPPDLFLMVCTELE